jgi:hypothetical protein
MTTQTVYVHLNGSRSIRLKGTTTDGTEASVSTDQTPALSIGDWAGEQGVVITHAICSADTFARYAYIRSRAGITKAIIPCTTTGKVQMIQKLAQPVKIEIGDLVRVMSDA